MNVFLEFHKIAQRLEEGKVRYALIGGIAMSFYGPLRATKDIDFLVCEEDIKAVRGAIEAEGFADNESPITFSSGLSLHRFLKFAAGEEMPLMVDVLVANTEDHKSVVQRAVPVRLEGTGDILLAEAKDMIWLKSARNSGQDQDDIQILKEVISENEN